MADVYFSRGGAKYALKIYKEAIDDYNKAIELDSKSADGYNDRGNVYYDLKLYKNALDDYNKAIELDPNAWETYLSRGDAKLFLNDMDGFDADNKKGKALKKLARPKKKKNK